MEVVSLENAVTERDHRSGSLEAPVTLLEYGNFECLHCGNRVSAIRNFEDCLAINCGLFFVTSLPVELILIPRAPPKPLKLPAQKKVLGHAQTSCLPTRLH